MKRSKAKNGLSIEENIKLTEERPGSFNIVAYFVQILIIIILVLSILYSFISGMKIEIYTVGLAVRVVLFVCFFFAVFLCRKYLKFTLPVIGVVYAIVAFVWRDDIYTGFAKTANAVLELYNTYFGKSLDMLEYNISYVTDYNNAFIYFFSFLLCGFLCYIIIYGRNVISYLIVTVPIVFSSLIIGYVPSLLPYVGYVAGTIGILGVIIVEKYGRAGSTAKKPKTVFYQHSSSKVIIQVISICSIAFLLGIAYLYYSPERYEKEFRAEEIRMTAKEKFDQLMSGELLKDTFMGNMFRSKSGNSGLNKGALNKVESIEYTHETALKVTTAGGNLSDTCYLRGYVGQQYNSNHWMELSSKDEKRLKELENSLTLSKNVESINSSLMNLLSHSPYISNDYIVTTMRIENVAANKSVSYIPYNVQNNLVNERGNLKAVKDDFTYVRFPLHLAGGSSLSEKFRIYEFMNMLKINLVNSSIYKNYFGLEMNPDWQSQVKPDRYEALNEIVYAYGSGQKGIYQDDLKVPLKDIYAGDSKLDDNLPLFVNRTIYTSELGDYIANMNEYGKEENAYYEFVRDVYTRLPDTGLEKVKKLVAGHEVSVTPTTLNGENYSQIEQLGGISSLEYTYSQDRLDAGVKSYVGEGAIEENDSIQAKYYDAIEFVRNYLALNTTYSLKPGKAPDGEDYVEYFLFTNKKGFCVHYATAATVMLRAMGVPARYVEGYVVTENDFANARTVGKQNVIGYSASEGEISQTAESVEIDVEDANAHSWVEVYLPGMGWQPVEMTAPYVYYNTIEIPEMNTNPKATLKPTPTPTLKPTPTPTSTPKVSAKPKPSVAPKPTKTPIGSTNTSSRGGGLVRWFKNLGDTAKKIVITIFILLCLLSGILLVIYLRVFLIKKYQEAIRQKLSNNERVLYDHKRMDVLLKHFHLTYKSNEPYAEFVTRLVETCTFLEEQQANTYYATLLKAKFKNGSITDEEVGICEKFYRDCANGLFKQSPAWKRWIYKRIYLI